MPWSTICSSRPLTQCHQLDEHALVVGRRRRWSDAPSARGSCRRPVRVTTCGLPTVSSKPSRRMISTRMASCSSPRPWTSQVSGRSVGSTLIDTLPTSSASRRDLTKLSRGQLLTALSGQWRRVDADGHRDGRFVDGDDGQRDRGSSGSASVSPMVISGDPGDGDDVARDPRIRPEPARAPCVSSSSVILTRSTAAVGAAPGRLLTLADRAVVDAAQRQPAQVRRGVQVGDVGLQRSASSS